MRLTPLFRLFANKYLILRKNKVGTTVGTTVPRWYQILFILVSA